MDLGFMFLEQDKDSTNPVLIIPGCRGSKENQNRDVEGCGDIKVVSEIHVLRP